MCDPVIMCRQHLLGEHRELHALYGCLREGISLDGYLKYGLIEMGSLWGRHLALVREMEARGYRHKSPLPGYEDLPYRAELPGVVDRSRELAVLLDRCGRCWSRAKAREVGVGDQGVLAVWEAAGAAPLTAKRLRQAVRLWPQMNLAGLIVSALPLTVDVAQKSGVPTEEDSNG